MKKFILSIVAALALSVALPQDADAGRIVVNGKTMVTWTDKDIDWYVLMLEMWFSNWEWGIHQDEWAGCDGMC